MIKTNGYLCLLFTLLLAQAQAQLQLHTTVLAASGSSYESSDLKLEWTLGETMVATHSNTFRLCEGFHQQKEATIVSTYEAPELDFKLHAFPNPVGPQLTLQAEQPRELRAQLVNLSGQLLRQRQLRQRTEQIDVSGLPPGLYFLKVHNASGLHLKTFKIIKE